MKDLAKPNKSTRREFLTAAAALGTFTIVPRHVLGASGQTAPSDRLNVGCIGVGGMMGASDVQGVASENIYALCDVDDSQMEKMAVFMPDAKVYKDFRVMLDKEAKNLDAVTVTIPDHMHASVAVRAMERGLNVYCQKPLTQSVWEARLMSKAAAIAAACASPSGSQPPSCSARGCSAGSKPR